MLSPPHAFSILFNRQDAKHAKKFFSIFIASRLCFWTGCAFAVFFPFSPPRRQER